jgi:hypothetical protein
LEDEISGIVAIGRLTAYSYIEVAAGHILNEISGIDAVGRLYYLSLHTNCSTLYPIMRFQYRFLSANGI